MLELRPDCQEDPMQRGVNGLDPNRLHHVREETLLEASGTGGFPCMTGPVDRGASYEACGSELWTMGQVRGCDENTSIKFCISELPQAPGRCQA